MRFSVSAWTSVPGVLLPVLACAGGCTSILGIDENYVVGEGNATGGTAVGGAGSGGRSSGGAGGTGGRVSTGGTGGSGPTGGAAGACATTSECGSGKKCCGGGCVAPSPAIGCSLNDCTACPVPIANADPLCAGTQCSAQCASGYVPYEGACVLASSIDGSAAGGSPGTGGTAGTGGAGAGGATGTGGTSAQCKPASCPSCNLNPKGPVPCCMQDNSCSCSWFNVGSVGYCL